MIFFLLVIAFSAVELVRIFKFKKIFQIFRIFALLISKFIEKRLKFKKILKNSLQLFNSPPGQLPKLRLRQLLAGLAENHCAASPVHDGRLLRRKIQAKHGIDGTKRRSHFRNH